MALDLSLLHNVLANEPGLLDNLSPEQLAAGLAAADSLVGMLAQAIDTNHLNDDGVISVSDLYTISAALQGDSALLALYTAAHGDDSWDDETGYHLLQNDGGSLIFQDQNLVDTVIDAIFHFGFQIVDGHFLNEDGDQNQEVGAVAGWLNYFVNGVNIVYGSDGEDYLYSGRYSPSLADAANELWYAGAGNDNVSADEGNDTVWAGTGDDRIDGGYGNDLVYGEDGNDDLDGDQGHDKILGGGGDDGLGGGSGRDTLNGGEGNDQLWGDAGNDSLLGCNGDDTLYGGSGADTLSGGAGNDEMSGGSGTDNMYAGAGNDVLSGDSGNDTVNGCDGNDEVNGDNGNDLLMGGLGNDTLCGGEGADTIQGNAGGDTFYLWEDQQSVDVLIFGKSDAGHSRATIDHVEGFESGVDKIDLRAYVGATLEDIDFSETGGPSFFYDGRYLRIDGNGDGRTDSIIEFRYVESLSAGDFLLA